MEQLNKLTLIPYGCQPIFCKDLYTLFFTSISAAMAASTGLEPAIFAVTGRRGLQLPYEAIYKILKTKRTHFSESL